MKTKETIKISFTERIEIVKELELPCYRMAWCNKEPWAIYKISGTEENPIVECVEFTGKFPIYDLDCVPNAFREGNTESSEMEWLDALQLVINHLNKEVEASCKVETV